METYGTDSAFPTEEFIDNDQNIGCVKGGLTKREYFAAMAMQGVCASTNPITAYDVAAWSVKMADALITELNKEQKP